MKLIYPQILHLEREDMAHMLSDIIGIPKTIFDDYIKNCYIDIYWEETKETKRYKMFSENRNNILIAEHVVPKDITENMIKEFLDHEVDLGNLSFDAEKDIYYCEYYMGYDDVLEEQTINEILSSSDPQETLQEKLYNWHMDWEMDVLPNIYELLEHFGMEELDVDKYLQTEEKLYDFLETRFPYEKFESQVFNKNIIKGGDNE